MPVSSNDGAAPWARTRGGGSLGKRKRGQTADEKGSPSSSQSIDSSGLHKIGSGEATEPLNSSDVASVETRSQETWPQNQTSKHPTTTRRRNQPKAKTKNPAPEEDNSDPSPKSTSTNGKGKTQKPSERSRPEPKPSSWPPYLSRLSKLHRALNLVTTFLAARRASHLTPLALESVKEAVQGQCGFGVEVEDVAGVVWVYAWGEARELEAQGERNEDQEQGGGSNQHNWGRQIQGEGQVKRCSRVRFEYVTQEAEDEFDANAKGEQVLVFEFLELDKQLKPEKEKGRGSKEREDKIRMPSVGAKQLSKVIERREEKFAEMVELFVLSCKQRGKDPDEVVKQGRGRFIPRLPEDTPPNPDSLPLTIPTERKPISEIVEELKCSSWYVGQIVPDGHRVLDPQEAIYGELNFPLGQDLVNALYNSKGITPDRLYSHQAAAINALHAGHHVVVATSTSSGKSLVYQLPVLHVLEEDKNARAMYIFPTKALAQDQKRSLQELISWMPSLEGIVVETYDGDTPQEYRRSIRENASVIFTNPDMLHAGVLPQEEGWRMFLKGLRYVVVDELHYYNGLLGSHVAWVMRRLRRVCAALGNSDVKFVSCSATVANPEGHFRRLFGIEDNVTVIDFDGSPSGRKEFLVWNTPYKVPGDPSSGRGNALLECSRLFCQLILRGVRTIAFCRVREQCEKLVAAVKKELESLDRGEVAGRVMAYRGGYTAQDRRQIEADMFSGRLVGIVATTALELGVDIGTLDCVLTWGFPYTIANLRQQSGRAGRRNKDSLAILVGDAFATDQYYMQHPDELFSRPNCALQIDLDNLLVKEGHLQCAAGEMPIHPEQDKIYFGPDLPQLCAERLIPDDEGFYHCHDHFRPFPWRFVSIRDVEEDKFAIVDTTNGRNVVLEELDASRATFTIYDGAIFLHQGTTYLVRDFSPDRKIARVEKVKVDYLTSQRDFTDVDPIATLAIKPLQGSPYKAYYGTIRITQVVFGFFKVDPRRGNKILDAVPVHNPPVVRYSKGMWLDIPACALDILKARKHNPAAAIHAAQHALASLVPTFVMSSTQADIRTECKSPIKEFARRPTNRKRPARLALYDAKGGPGGAGINTKAFEFVDDLLRMALDRVRGCECLEEKGCVECVCSEFCVEGNEVMSKVGAEVVLKVLVGEEVREEEVPIGSWEEGMGPGETVVLAGEVSMASGSGSQQDGR